MASGSIYPLVMPKLGLTMTEGMVSNWLVQEGSAIGPRTEVADIETTKITTALETEHSGTLRRTVANEGETLPVGAIIGVIADPTVPDAEIDRFIEAFQAKFAEAAEAGEAVEQIEPVFVDVGGRRLRYLKMGEHDTPMVFLHGFAGDLNSWPFNQTMQAKARATYALDLPGHGESSKDVGKGTLVSLARIVVEFMAAVDIPGAHLVGHSLGGALAVEVAREHPDRATSLTLICSAGLGAEIDGEFIDGVIAANRRKEIRPYLERLFADTSLISRDLVNNVLKFKRLDGADQALRTIAKNVFPNGKQAKVLVETLRELSMPIQVIWGRDDRIIPVGHAEAVRGMVPVHIVEAAGHMVHMESAAEVNRLINAFVGNARTGGIRST